MPDSRRMAGIAGKSAWVTMLATTSAIPAMSAAMPRGFVRRGVSFWGMARP